MALEGNQQSISNALQGHSDLTLKKACDSTFMSRFLAGGPNTLVYICMWKVDYGCIDSIPQTPPEFNLFLSGGGNNVQPKRQKVDHPVHKSTFFPHTMQGSHTTMYRPHTKYATLPPIQICMGGGNSCPVVLFRRGVS